LDSLDCNLCHFLTAQPVLLCKTAFPVANQREQARMAVFDSDAKPLYVQDEQNPNIERIITV